MGKGGINANPISIALVWVCLIVHNGSSTKLRTFRREYGPFNQTHFEIFQVDRPATISNDALQVTPDSASPDFNLFNNSGRVLFRTSFKLWERRSGASVLASFNTSFLINIGRLQNGTPGEGLAFLIAPDLGLPNTSYGQFLGLTNASTDGDLANGVVAVELDTFRQDFDPDDNHVGIDLHTVQSNITEPLTPHGITLAPIGTRFYNVWVDYDGEARAMDVYISEQIDSLGPTPPKPASPVLSAADLDLSDHVHQYSYFGFSASTGRTNQLNCVLRWNLTVRYFADDHRKLLAAALGAGVPTLAVLLAAAAILGYWWRRRRIAATNPELAGALRSLPGMPREFEFRELKKATNGFDASNKLGQGGFGVVYRGVVAKENDMEIAVKWFSRETVKGEGDFLAELTIINRLRHKHLVKLLGWCHRKGKLLLVYEYMPNGSLDQHLFAPGPGLDWPVRYKIISGVSSALHYLHDEYEQRVVHRDLKASNIMLDSCFNSRLGDFGLARALDNEKTSYMEADGVLGTIGYIAPECFHTGKATQQSDIYAFGAVVLEVVCGQRPGTKVAGFQLLVDWVWSLHRDGKLVEAVDRRLGDQFVKEEAHRLLLLGLACCHPAAEQRPRTEAIVQIVSGAVPEPVVQTLKPAFVWPSSGSETTISTTMEFGSGWSPQYLSRDSYGGDQTVAWV